MMRLGMRLYQEPSCRMEMSCTECGGALGTDAGDTVDALAVSQCIVRGEPQDTVSQRCPKCGRVKTQVKEDSDGND